MRCDRRRRRRGRVRVACHLEVVADCLGRMVWDMDMERGRGMVWEAQQSLSICSQHCRPVARPGSVLRLRTKPTAGVDIEEDRASQTSVHMWTVQSVTTSRNVG